MMDSFNCLNSHMALYVEDLTEHPLELEKKKETAQKSERESPVLFLVGSMESISQRIAHLEQQLNNICTDDLVIESPERCGTSPYVGSFTLWYDPKKQRTQLENRSKEYDKKELQKFTKRFQLSKTKTDFVKCPKTKESTKETKPKPQLIELYQFPGFSYQGPMSLPHEISLRTIITKVVSAHKNTGAKMCPTRELYRFLSAPVAQKILLDCYWWIFLHRYKPDAECQSKLFGRVAKNYIQLLTLCQCSYYGDAFLNVFPSVLSQAIYCSFCFSFPQSLHQFRSDDFKAELCSLLWQWIGGICPISGVHNTWDYLTLEPKDETANGTVNQKRDSGASWFGLLNAEGHNGFSSTLDFRPRRYSVLKPSRKNSSAVNQPSLRKREVALSLLNEHLPGFEARELSKLKARMQFSKVSPTKESWGVVSSKVKLSRPLWLDLCPTALGTSFQAGTKSHWSLPSAHVQRATEAKSHPGCHRPHFTHLLFNLSGHSPLVQYYLEKQKVDSQAGVRVLVHRTEMQKPSSVPNLL